MSGKVFEDDNDLARNNCEKLYLDPTTADVKFVFRDSNESVPALKAILSVGSPVFNTMIYGSLPEKGDILIEDASPEAFQEFLQFFYLSKVRLTSENIFVVANLCKKYEMTEALKRCESAMPMLLTTTNMCSGYAVAKLLEIESVVKYCKQQINQNAAEILKSDDFLECDQKLLDEILRLVASNCSASVMVDACMAWAKAECGRNNLEETSENLKVQLGGSFACIPFNELNMGQFTRFITTYSGILSETDWIAIVSKMKEKEEGLLVCDRRYLSGDPSPSVNFFYDNNLTFFTANKPLLLTEIYFAPVSDNSEIRNLRVLVQLVGKRYWKTLSSSESSTWSTIGEGQAVLKQPILIEAQKEYRVEFIANDDYRCSNLWKNTPFKEAVKMQDGYEINFENNGPVSRLIFQMPNA